MSGLLTQAQCGFEAVFGYSPDGIWSAPGRVNLIGEHTDYNEGFALPFAIDRRTFAAIALAPAGEIPRVRPAVGRAFSEHGYGSPGMFAVRPPQGARARQPPGQARPRPRLRRRRPGMTKEDRRWAPGTWRGKVASVDDLAQSPGGARAGAPAGGSGAAAGREPLRKIPRTDQLLGDPRMRAAERRIGRDLVKAAIVRAQQRARNAEITPEQVADAAAAELPATAASLTPVINATGVLVHTNLGRAPLSQAAVEALTAAAGTCDVEFDLVAGTRAGQRGRGAIEALKAAVPPAQAAGVVNNNAAALVLAATALAAGKEIVISRGELIEIGDRFRLPDLLTSTGARLTEVGTTNRTTVADYRHAVTAQTGFILKVHPSNYRVEGFTAQATVAELAALGVPLVHDIGSGLLAPHPLLPGEPDAATSLRQGANLVTASGDKLLGGPQAGLILGDEDLVRRLLRHPLARALRIDKLTLAALEATIAGPLPPVARSLTADPAALTQRAQRTVAALAARGISAAVAATEAAVGGGGAPGVTLPSAAVALPEEFALPLRHGPAVRRGAATAVAGRIEKGMLLLDLRSVDPSDDDRIVAAVLAAHAAAASPA